MYDVQLQVYLINPFSKNQDAALAYLETVSSYLDMEKALASSGTGQHLCKG